MISKYRFGRIEDLNCFAYPDETLVNASYIAEGDGIFYGYGAGYFAAVPDGAEI